MKRSKISSLRETADRLWFVAVRKKNFPFICKSCNKTAQQIHHFYPKGSYSDLRYDLDNGVPLCMGCHFRLHHVSDPAINEAIKENMGTRWSNRLSAKAKDCRINVGAVKKNVGYYEKQIERLEKLI